MIQIFRISVSWPSLWTANHSSSNVSPTVQVGNIEQTLTWVFLKKSYLCRPFRRIKVHPLAPLLIQLLRYSMHLLGQMLHLDNSELWCFAGEPPTYIQGKELQAPQCPKTLYNLIHLFTRFCRYETDWNSFKHFGPAHLQNSCSTMSLQTDPTQAVFVPRDQTRRRFPAELALDSGVSKRQKLQQRLGRAQWALLPDMRNMSSLGWFWGWVNGPKFLSLSDEILWRT